MKHNVDYQTDDKCDLCGQPCDRTYVIDLSPNIDGEVCQSCYERKTRNNWLKIATKIKNET